MPPKKKDANAPKKVAVDKSVIQRTGSRLYSLTDTSSLAYLLSTLPNPLVPCPLLPRTFGMKNKKGGKGQAAVKLYVRALALAFRLIRSNPARPAQSSRASRPGRTQ
jgi:hypothetical protein